MILRQPHWEDILKTNLWYQADHDVGVWALLDGQWVPDLAQRLMDSGLEFCSLFEGPIDNERIASSPYLVRLVREGDFVDWLIREGWSKGWGVFFQAKHKAVEYAYPLVTADHVTRKRAAGEFFGSIDLESGSDMSALRLRRHFRKFARVRLDERTVVFRFFDPAVLKTYLANATANELHSFFGPIRFFVCEDYSDVLTLNAPQNMIVLSLVRSADEAEDVPRFLAKMLDLNQNEIRDIMSSPNYLTPVDREPEPTTVGTTSSPYPVIGKHHVEAFRMVEEMKFVEQVAIGLVSCMSDRQIELDEARIISSRNIPRGHYHGLKSRTDLINFVVCSARHGEGFPDSYERSKAAFAATRNHDQVNVDMLSRQLDRWASQEREGVIE